MELFDVVKAGAGVPVEDPLAVLMARKRSHGMAFDETKVNLAVIENGQPTGTICTFDTLADAVSYFRAHPDTDFWVYLGSRAGITAIDPSPGFSPCGNLVRITFPSTVTSIGLLACQQCANLVHADFPVTTGLTSIPYATFWDCTGLEEVSLPDRITSVENRAFCGCLSLRKAKVSTSTTVGENLLELPDSVTSIGEYAFWKCKALQNIVFPSSLTEIKRLAFAHCTSLRALELPSSTSVIVGNAFDDCDNLLSIVIHKPVNSISGAPWGAANAIVTWTG